MLRVHQIGDLTMLNNNGRQFMKFSIVKNELDGELTTIEFNQQYKEYLRGQELIAEQKLCIYPKKIKELDSLIETEGRELDKFLIRAMYKNNIDITNLDTSNITDLALTFSNLKDFNTDIGGKLVTTVIGNSVLNYNSWDISNVTTLYSMFYGATTFNIDINKWNTCNVDDMSYIFKNCKQFNQPLNNWDVSNVINMAGMFESAENFNQPLDKLGCWKSSCS
jgi:surface protein